MRAPDAQAYKMMTCFHGLFPNRQVNFEKEVCLADVMAANISKGPFDMGVPQRLCMEDQVCALLITKEKVL